MGNMSVLLLSEISCLWVSGCLIMCLLVEIKLFVEVLFGGSSGLVRLKMFKIGILLS